MPAKRSKKEKPGLRGAVRGLLKSQQLAVLATDLGNGPYCSLVGFVASSDLKSLFFATTRSTRKYRNMMSNPCVAMLIDSRSNEEADFHEAVAVTVLGRTEEVVKRPRSTFVKRYLAKHPHLRDFVLSPSCALFRVRVEKYVVVRRFQEVSELCPR